MNENLTPLQHKLLDMMKWFHVFCVQNQLHYYVLGGTMLGAARHKGFIPWDDDIDVGMPRKDYERLRQLVRGKGGRYVLEYPGMKKDYFYPYCKVYDTTTTLIENTRYRIKRGIFLDIFPLDGIGNSEEEAKKNYEPIRQRLNILLATTTGWRKRRRRIKNLMAMASRYIPKFLLDNRKLLLKVCDKCAQYDFATCLYGGNLVGAWRFKEVMPRSVMGDPTLYPFEDMQVYGAQDYAGYLSHLYGNWEQLPSREKQMSHHDFLYLNLEKSYLDDGDNK